MWLFVFFTSWLCFFFPIQPGFCFPIIACVPVLLYSFLFFCPLFLWFFPQLALVIISYLQHFFTFFPLISLFFYPQPFRLCIVLHLCKFKWVNHKTTSGASDIKLKLYQLYVKGLGNRSKETHFPAPQTRPDYRKTSSHSLFVISEQ